ncbi:MAG TPA: peptidylprolyl isomerase [Candidatus Eisenbacteria bacterium]|nr:peptidylprolyl isomerase [Candidatus Eisenbacteria bacterium]
MVSGFIRYTGVMLALGAFGAQPAFAAGAAKKSAASSDEVAVMETTKGRMVIEFWDKEAPQTVDNFKKLARQGYFDGTGFHRIIKGFMIQGGDPKSKNPKAPDLGTGDPGYKIKDEFNSHKHVAGVLSMANSGTPNSAGSQFFIMDGAAPFLDGKYTAFGHVIEGMNVEKDIANTPVGPNAMMGGEKSKPLEWTTVKSVKIVPRSSLVAKAGGTPASAKPAAATEVKSTPASAPAAEAAKAPEATAAAPAKTEQAPPPAASSEAKPDSAK